MQDNTIKKRRGGRHPPGYTAKIRKGKRIVILYFTEAEFEALSNRVKRDGTTKQAAGRNALIHYARNGLDPR